MDIPAEAWIASAYGGIILLAAVGRYLTLPRHAAKNDPVLAGVGLELGSREQTERLIGEVHGIRIAVEILADRRTEEFQEMHQELLERMDTQERRKEQEEQKPRRQPPRRR
ncbi:hypothetical protein NKI13_24545 [Mesorhizobium australicum]|uniref:hypothetical protein n=1 Tax=Mesorhizobium australicum TaxID=536018 RepID=UPI0033360880